MKVLGKDLSRANLLRHALILRTRASITWHRGVGNRYEDSIDSIRTQLTPTEKQLLFQLVRQLPESAVYAEIGSYYGASAACAAAACTSGQQVHCIDTFRNTATSDPEEDVLPAFQSNVARYADRVHTHRGLAHDLATELDFKIDLLFIDGDHSWQGITRDLSGYLPLLKSTSVLAMHDVAWGDCRRAFRELVEPSIVRTRGSLPNLYAGICDYDRILTKLGEPTP